MWATPACGRPPRAGCPRAGRPRPRAEALDSQVRPRTAFRPRLRTAESIDDSVGPARREGRLRASGADRARLPGIRGTEIAGRVWLRDAGRPRSVLAPRHECGCHPGAACVWLADLHLGGIGDRTPASRTSHVRPPRHPQSYGGTSGRSRSAGVGAALGVRACHACRGPRRSRSRADRARACVAVPAGSRGDRTGRWGPQPPSRHYCGTCRAASTSEETGLRRVVARGRRTEPVHSGDVCADRASRGGALRRAASTNCRRRCS